MNRSGYVPAVAIATLRSVSTRIRVGIFSKLGNNKVKQACQNKNNGRESGWKTQLPSLYTSASLFIPGFCLWKRGDRVALFPYLWILLENLFFVTQNISTPFLPSSYLLVMCLNSKPHRNMVVCWSWLVMFISDSQSRCTVLFFLLMLHYFPTHFVWFAMIYIHIFPPNYRESQAFP